ncbi:MAG: IS3 family transposase, partial [Chloroflexota bacterium]|nr:IS3 family transposase [Chloroflexota bacterium]
YRGGRARTRPGCADGCASWRPSAPASATAGCTPCREGIAVNHKRVERLYRAEGLAVRKRGRKRVARDGRGRATPPGRPNQQWGVDFLSDALAWGRRIRLFTVVDVFTREALASEVDTSLPGERVVRTLARVAAERGTPEEIVLDNGPELAGKALDQWAYEQNVRLRFIEPGKPIQNAFVESFHGRLRDECLDQHWFLGLTDARATVEAWRRDYNRLRPHSALGYRAPEEVQFAFDGSTITRQESIGLSE